MDFRFYSLGEVFDNTTEKSGHNAPMTRRMHFYQDRERLFPIGTGTVLLENQGSNGIGVLFLRFRVDMVRNQQLFRSGA